MNKSLERAHVKRSRLRNLYLKNKIDTSRIAYMKQHNCCSSLLRKTKRDHFADLDVKKLAVKMIVKPKKTVKPLLSDKMKSSEKITVEGKEIIIRKKTPFLIKSLIQYSRQS